jgi:HEAT repeat protein
LLNASQAEPAAIENAIPQLSLLLEDDNKDVRVAGANVLVKLAECSEFQAILKLIITKSTFQAKLRPTIENTIPHLFQLLKDDDKDVRVTAAGVLAKLAEQ